jgi:hypothetical protein
MLIDCWMPVRKGSGKIKRIIGYKLYPTDDMILSKKKGYVVRYTCDKCMSNKVHTTSTSTFFREGVVYNTLSFQTCRNCRSRISEYEIKKTQISYDEISKSMLKFGYRLITTMLEYNVSHNKSQMKLNCVCDNNHEYYCTWNNWKKGKKCRKCYDKNRKEDAIKYKYGYSLYYYLVWKETNANYKNFQHLINVENYKRSKKYHIDHIYSIYDGYINNILPSIISSPVNLRMLRESVNLSKGKKSDINIDELFKKYQKFKFI